MKALVQNTNDKTLALTDVPLPVPGAGEHLIRVHAVTLSAGELEWIKEPKGESHVPGVDVAASIVSAPPNSRFVPGDEVYARTTFPRPGNAREFSIALENELAYRPTNLSAEEAVTIPMSALTAWQGLFDHGGLLAPSLEKPEETGEGNPPEQKRVLVTAASGGCGIWAVQLAKLAGAYVIGTCGPSNKELVRDLGADEVLDYSTIGLKEWVEQDLAKKVDLVFDCVNPQSLDQAWMTLKDGGLLLTITPPRDMDYKEELERPEGVSEGVSGKFFIMHPDGKALEEVSKLVEEKKCKPVVDSVWEFKDWEKALEVVNGGHAKGKVVLKVGS